MWRYSHEQKGALFSPWGAEITLENSRQITLCMCVLSKARKEVTDSILNKIGSYYLTNEKIPQ
jgi:hypothetical protein